MYMSKSNYDYSSPLLTTLNIPKISIKNNKKVNKNKSKKKYKKYNINKRKSIKK